MVSLNDINEEVEAEYAPVPFEDVKGGTAYLLPLLTLSPAKSDKAFKLIQSLRVAQKQDDIATILTLARQLIETVGKGDSGKRIVADLKSTAALMKVVEHWMEATQPGEASRSES